jgi:hypothetical protein
VSAERPTTPASVTGSAGPRVRTEWERVAAWARARPATR